MAADGARPTRPPEGPSSGIVPLLAVLGLIAIAACVVLSVLAVTDRRQEVHRTQAQAAAERQAGLIALQLQEIDAAIENVDVEECEPSGVVGARVSCVGTAAGTPAALAPMLDDPAARVALAQARDRGLGVLSAPLSSDPPTALVVAPIYDVSDAAGDEQAPDDGEGAGAPAGSDPEEPQLSREPSTRTVTARRDEIWGYVVGVLAIDEILAASMQPDSPPFAISDADAVLTDTGVGDGELVHADVGILDRRWTVASPIESLGWWRPVVVAVVVLGLLAAVMLGLADRQRRRVLAVQSDVARRAEQRSVAIRTLAGIVQQSQDLDEILPALAVQLSDELGLAGLSLAVATSQSREREVFVHGTTPDRAVRPSPGRPGPLAPGETLALDLHRAERSIGTLRILAGEPLDVGETDLVAVAGEMVTSTVVAARSIEQQQEAVSRLEALDELKTTFLGVASHELRTPATAISGLATLLAQRWDVLPEKDRQAFAQRIATNADSLNALVQDLLDFARLERGDLELVLAPVELSGVVEGVLARLESVWASHGVERHLDPDVHVLGDVNALERIVTNLVSNAVKFSPEGAPVSVTVERDGSRVRLLVDDRGPGVPPQEREKIFVRFFRGAGDAVVRTRGVGIGLSVVQDFVAQMGGAVRVEDSPEGGARFVVELEECDRSALEERDVATT